MTKIIVEKLATNAEKNIIQKDGNSQISKKKERINVQ